MLSSTIPGGVENTVTTAPLNLFSNQMPDSMDHIGKASMSWDQQASRRVGADAWNGASGTIAGGNRFGRSLERGNEGGGTRMLDIVNGMDANKVRRFLVLGRLLLH
jgi:hypothetical protein